MTFVLPGGGRGTVIPGLGVDVNPLDGDGVGASVKAPLFDDTGASAGVGNGQGIHASGGALGVGGGTNVMQPGGPLVGAYAPGYTYAAAGNSAAVDGGQTAALNPLLAAPAAAVGTAGAVAGAAVTAPLSLATGTATSVVRPTRGEPVERGWAGTGTMFALAAMFVVRIIMFAFAMGNVFGGQKVEFWSFWLSYWIIFGVGTAIVLGLMLFASLWGETAGKMPERMSLMLFVFVHIVFFVMETAWSGNFFRDNPIYRRHPGNNPAPTIGDAEFCTAQRLMATFVFNTFMYGAFALVAWLYVWDIQVSSPFFPMRPVGSRVQIIQPLGDSARTSRQAFASFAGITLAGFALYSAWTFCAITGLAPKIDLKSFFIIWIIFAIMWVFWLIATGVLNNSRRSDIADVVNGLEDAQSKLLGEQSAENYTHHFKMIWSFHMIILMWVIAKLVFFIVMYTDKDLNKDHNLRFDKSRVSDPDPLLHTVQESTYYITQATFVMDAAMFPVWVYMAASLVMSWGLFVPDRVMIRANLFSFVDADGNGVTIDPNAPWLLAEKWMLRAWYLYLFITAAFAVSVLTGWYHLSNHFLAWTATTFAVEALFFLTIGLMNWNYSAAFADIGKQIGPTVAIVRWRSFWTLGAIIFMKFFFFWDFWTDYVKDGNNDVIPRSEIKGTVAATAEVSVLWWNMWHLWLALFAISAFAFSDYHNSIGNPEFYITSFTTQEAEGTAPGIPGTQFMPAPSQSNATTARQRSTAGSPA